MAHDKPYRDMEIRPKALHNGKHHHCMHSLIDDNKLTKIPNHRWYSIFITSCEQIHKYIKRNNKLKKLIKRRKDRKNGLRNL